VVNGLAGFVIINDIAEVFQVVVKGFFDVSFRAIVFVLENIKVVIR
jgi:hypothetical protein